ncbi:MAG TPA: hypothetical protein PLP27_04140 [Crocinitomicaceae bacterium]|nr:hypothetical protein [Crocinitomicaceae bacterium]
MTFVAQAQIPTAGLQLHYPFDGNFNDVSGNNRHATLKTGSYQYISAGSPNTSDSAIAVTSSLGTFGLQYEYTSAEDTAFRT